MQTGKSVERLFPFAIRSRIIVPGGDNVARQRRKLQFVLIATDLSENSKGEIARIEDLPKFTIYSAQELQKHFGINGAKVLGFKKSDLARSILKEFSASAEDANA